MLESNSKCKWASSREKQHQVEANHNSEKKQDRQVNHFEWKQQEKEVNHDGRK